MAGKIHRYLADDHRRLDALIERATAAPEHVGASTYTQFRAGLLKHIGMEERSFSGGSERRGGEPLPVAARLRLDHGALADCSCRRRLRRLFQPFAQFWIAITQSKKTPAECTINARKQ